MGSAERRSLIGLSLPYAEPPASDLAPTDSRTCKPYSTTLTQMGAGGKVAVMWMAPGEVDYTATRTVCTTECSVTMSDLASGNHTYYIAWETAAGVVVASSARRPAVVAIR